MKTYAKLLTAALLTLGAFAANAMPVQADVAERVARNFWNTHRDRNATELVLPMQQLDTRWDAFYIFTPAECDGFVIVAADDAVRPVLAYSFKNRAQRDSIGRETAWWLDMWQHEVDAVRQADMKPTPDVAQQWQRLYAGSATPHPLMAIAPMVTTQWDQDAPYNDSCPSRNTWGGTVHAATGCVATAMAQVMRYWSFPEHGIGSHTYEAQSVTGWGAGFGTQTVDFANTAYDWQNMPNTLTQVSADAEVAAVATLMYHCGVAVDMMYGTAQQGGSGAFVHNIPLMSYGHTLNGMIEYFGYSSEATGLNRKYYADSTWQRLVKAEIDAGRPVIYAGGDETSGAHCFVCDGYDEEERFHFNWGWSGAGDGYYTLDHLAPGLGGTGGGTGTYNFSAEQQILVGIRPPQTDDTLCVIRHFPYSQDFETAPTCWSATSSSAYSYSWMVHDTTGVEGNYSAVITQSYYGTSTDHLLSPIINTPSTYTVAWKARSLGSRNGYYSLGIGDTTMADTTSADWAERQLQFTVAEGEALRLDFTHQTTNNTPVVIIDNITITKATTEGIEKPTAEAVAIYPNPTTAIATVRCAEGVVSIEVLDLAGRVLQTSRGNSVDLSAMPNGIYLLRCVTPSSTSMHRVVKQANQ